MAIAIDPVCGMEVETERAALTFEYQGTTYYFCSRGCLLEFKDDPERFLAADHKPSM
jgi:Cu+-exporting ATPase